MRLVDVAGGRQVERFGSVGVTALPVVRADAYSVTSLRIEPGGVIGRHQATQRQLLVVIEGGGWTAGDDRVRTPIRAGQAVVFEAGEAHETGTDSGLTVLAIESADLPIP